MPNNSFRTYDLALDFYQQVDAYIKSAKVTGAKRDQLDRAALSIPLNLTEGNSRPMGKERRRFYMSALGSLREVQAILNILKAQDLIKVSDVLGAHLHKLHHYHVHRY